MNAYEWKLEARRQRLERAADRAKQEGESRLATADQMAYQMNGQPILVGHHSEKRHRRQIDKMWNHTRQGFTRLKEAEELARRIRETKRRIEELTRLADRASESPTEATTNGVTVVIDPGDNRVTMTFPRRLSREEYRAVKSRGFLWSPTRGGFTRKLCGSGAEHVAQQIAEKFTP